MLSSNLIFPLQARLCYGTAQATMNLGSGYCTLPALLWLYISPLTVQPYKKNILKGWPIHNNMPYCVALSSGEAYSFNSYKIDILFIKLPKKTESVCLYLRGRERYTHTNVHTQRDLYIVFIPPATLSYARRLWIQRGPELLFFITYDWQTGCTLIWDSLQIQLDFSFQNLISTWWFIPIMESCLHRKTQSTVPFQNYLFRLCQKHNLLLRSRKIRMREYLKSILCAYDRHFPVWKLPWGRW